MDTAQGAMAGDEERAGEGVFAGCVFVQCPYCEYALTGLRENRCPECGAEITEADARLDARRRVFLELTRFRVFGWNAVVLLLSMVSTWGLVLIPFGMMVLGAWTLPGRMPHGLERRVRRRVWLLSLWWLCLPWLGLMVVPFVIDWLYWNTAWFDFGSGGMGYMLEIVGPAGFGAALLSLYLVSILMWRRRLVRLGRAAGLERGPEKEPFPWRCASTRFAVYPVLGVLVAWVVIFGIIGVLDRWMPNWGTGW
ncbi:hypothetical protein MNBD_PLANCTO03-1998 [hydrothermal vent metagenome]|uniref:Uncharacterized protein n=1 Tax=hydrothermal vent metagenome TaxID=652676 RepID=A0A3B1E5D9_9ZZZZ